MLQMIYISNKCHSFELSIHQRILKINIVFHKNYFNIDNKSEMFLEHQIVTLE